MNTWTPVVAMDTGKGIVTVGASGPRFWNQVSFPLSIEDAGILRDMLIDILSDPEELFKEGE